MNNISKSTSPQVWSSSSTTALSIASSYSKQIGDFRVLFYDEYKAQIAKELSKLIFAVEPPMLYNPTKHDENVDWIMYTVDGCNVDVEIEDADAGLSPRQIVFSFENDQTNAAMIDLYALSAEAPFTVSLQYLNTAGDPCEVLTFQDVTFACLISNPVNSSDNGPCTTEAAINFTTIIHSLRK